MFCERVDLWTDWMDPTMDIENIIFEKEELLNQILL